MDGFGGCVRYSPIIERPKATVTSPRKDSNLTLTPTRHPGGLDLRVIVEGLRAMARL